VGGKADVEGVMERFRRVYGSGPGHLLAMLICFSIVAYAAYSIFENARPWSVLLWLAGAIVVHDFVFLPLYTGAFWLASRAGRVSDSRQRMVVLQHLVAPAALSGLLFLTWMPLILRLSAANTGRRREWTRSLTCGAGSRSRPVSSRLQGCCTQSGRCAPDGPAIDERRPDAARRPPSPIPRTLVV
jgi:hypothetical protein